jgi:recombination DNA repair RAD52 pathway protein
MKIDTFLSSIKLPVTKTAFIASPVAGQNDQAKQQISQMLQGLPPQVAQQAQQQMQQIDQMPPVDQSAAYQQLAQQLQQQAQQAQQQQAPDTSQAKQQDPNAAENSDTIGGLDDTKVTLTMRELLDISSGGKVSMMKAKVKDVLHKSKLNQHKLERQMQQDEQKAQQEAQQQQAEQEAQQQAQQGVNFQGGGVYPTAPDGSTPAAGGQPQQAAPQQPAAPQGV